MKREGEGHVMRGGLCRCSVDALVVSCCDWMRLCVCGYSISAERVWVDSVHGDKQPD